ncbi:MAG: hypothetical protein WC683_03145 [bacterium]
MSEGEKCERCGSIGTDRRTLCMACFYDMRELGIPLMPIGLHGVVVKSCGDDPKFGCAEFEAPPYKWEEQATTYGLFSMRVCKGCRGEWMEAVQKWFRSEPDSTCRYNNDQTDAPSDLGVLMAKYEALRVESIALQQQIGDTLRRVREGSL